MQTVKSLKKGDYFKVNGTVYVRDCYDRETKKYCCFRFDDISRSRLFYGDRLVDTDFIF